MLEKKNDNEIKTKFSFSIDRNLKIQFVCDECCLPLSLYGENIILQTEDDRFVTHMLCDLHLKELFG